MHGYALRKNKDIVIMNRVDNYPEIEIRNLGPIKACKMRINKFSVLTGPQASGKSTIAKAIYFCQSIKSDIYAKIISMKNEADKQHTLVGCVEKRLRRKFLGIFGSTWAMPMDMHITYKYDSNKCIEVYLEEDNSGEQRNFVRIWFSDVLVECINSFKIKESYTPDETVVLKDELDRIFASDFECVYVPAGRGMITLLTDQLSYIFSSLDEMASNTIDYCTRAYVEQIFRLRPIIKDGLDSLLTDSLQYSENKIDAESVRQMLLYCETVLKGKYYYSSGEERLIVDDDKRYVKVNYASSGQQEAMWIFNLMVYYIINKKSVFLILEEPEAHLYPDAQQILTKALGLFVNVGNAMLITTHSPYILGEINNMIYASRIIDKSLLKDTIEDNIVIDNKEITALFFENGKSASAMSEGAILNELIDGASESVNNEHDKIMELVWDQEDEYDKSESV